MGSKLMEKRRDGAVANGGGSGATIIGPILGLAAREPFRHCRERLLFCVFVTENRMRKGKTNGGQIQL